LQTLARRFEPAARASAVIESVVGRESDRRGGTAAALNGFVVEIIRSNDGRVPSGWLSETGGGFGVVSDRRQAWVFPTHEDALIEADKYYEAHRGRCARYVIRPR
jgi:hypothetical protein